MSKPNNLFYAESNATLWKPQLDILVNRICDEIRTIFAGGPLPIGRVESSFDTMDIGTAERCNE